MEKEINISIKGLQYQNGEGNPVEVICPGTYYKKGDKHYVLYEELNESFQQPNKSTMKIAPGCVEVIKKGEGASHMIFEENKKNMTFYQTPYGELLVGVATDKIEMKESNEEILLDISYGLEVNYQYVSDCHITIKVENKERISL